MRHTLIYSLVVCAASWIGACSRDNHETAPDALSPESLIEKNKVYCELSSPAYQERRWVVSECDGAGFTALRRLSCGDSDLSVFEAEDGRLFRDPGDDSCYPKPSPESGSSSGFSKDMLLMRMVAAWKDQDLAWVERFLAYAEPKGFVFCDAEDNITKLSRCLASPGLINLLYGMRDKMKGTPPTLAVQQSSDAIPEDFEAHLRVLYIWLSGRVFGGITDLQKSILFDLADRETENALYEAVAARYRDGDMERTYILLANTRHWPNGRLPRKETEHCEPYLFQRDRLKNGQLNPDWEPCPEEAGEHSGTDFGVALFMSQSL